MYVSATRMLVGLVNQWMAKILSFRMTISKITALIFFPMIVPIDPIALYKVIPNFTDEFLRVNILARPRNVPNRWNCGYSDYF